MDVVRGDHLTPAPQGDLDERIVAGAVDGVAVVPDLDGEVLPAECVDQPHELALCGRRTVGHERRGHDALATTGEHQMVSR